MYLLAQFQLLLLAKRPTALHRNLACRWKLNDSQSTADADNGGLGNDRLLPTGKAVELDLLRELDRCQTASSARRLLEDVLCSGLDRDENGNHSSLFNSVKIPRGASDRPISDGDLAIQTKVRNKKYNIIELIELGGDRDADRAALAVFSVTVASVASVIVADQNLPGPEILRFVVVWLLSFAPLALVGRGIANPDQVQTLLVNLQRNLFPAYRTRMIQHEAGHFLMGHLLGLPIKGYQANAVKNAVEFYPFNDADVGRDLAKMLGFESRRNIDSKIEMVDTNSNAPYFSNKGRGASIVQTQSVFRNSNSSTSFLQIQPENDPTAAWPFRGFDHETIDKLTVISLAGVCSEILAFGNTEGGVADLSQLRQIFASAQPELSDREIENRIRFALGYTMSLLRLHLDVLDALAQVMERRGSVAECVIAIESQPRASTVGGLSDYEQRRKEAFRSRGFGLLERLLLGNVKNADTEDHTIVEGKGGGYRKEAFRLTGDEPLYVSLFLATSFLVWASTGGLSLH